jgi:hypothetical protein
VSQCVDVVAGAGRPTMHAALGFAHCIAKSDGIELGFHRFVTSLEILDHVRERMQLPLTHINYLQVRFCQIFWQIFWQIFCFVWLVSD